MLQSCMSECVLSVWCICYMYNVYLLILFTLLIPPTRLCCSLYTREKQERERDRVPTSPPASD